MRRELDPIRHLCLEGAYNVRDIGGYGTSDSRRTRWRVLLRADSLHRLSRASQSMLIEYGVRTIVDLRATSEVTKEPDVFANSSAVAYHHQNLLGDALIAELANLPALAEGTKRISEIYTTALDRRQSHVAETLETLASPGVLPALLHCTGGTDRTGLIAALVLGLAGVPAETIVEDYGLSARYFVGRYASERGTLAVGSPGHTWEEYQQRYCPPKAMLVALGHLDRRYGGIERYVLRAGLTREQISELRSALTE